MASNFQNLPTYIWADPVETLSDLPNGRVDGEARIVLDENAIYRWDSVSQTWFVLISASSPGLQTLNGQAGSSQTFVAGVAGSSFNISSSGNVHTFNLPNQTGDVTSVGTVTTIPDSTITNAKQATMVANTIKGNNTGSTSNPLDLTVTQTTAMLDVAVGDTGVAGTKGLVPAPAANDSLLHRRFLRADATWSGLKDYYLPTNEAIASVNNFVQRHTTANQWFGMAYSPELNIYVAIAASGTSRFAISRDGITWRDITAPQSSTWTKVVWAPALRLFCAISYDGASRVATSPDGQTWTLRTAVGTNTWYDICWSNELNLFAAVSLTGGNPIMTSPDGITWTGRTVSDGTTTNFYTVCWSPELSLFCAVRLNGSAFTSPDGITWTARTISDKTWSAVCWSSEVGLFVAVGTTGTNRCDTSPDGITWTSRGIQANAWRRVKWSKDHGLFIAVASGGQMSTSPDGITWTARTAPQATNQWYEILCPEGTGQIIISGITGTGRIMTSRYTRGLLKQSDPMRSRLAIFVTGTAFSAGVGSADNCIVVQSATAATVTVQPDATVFVPTGTIFKYVRDTTATVTFAAGVGVTIKSKSGFLNISDQNGVVYLEKIAAETWILSGDLS